MSDPGEDMYEVTNGQVDHEQTNKQTNKQMNDRMNS